MRVTRLFFLCVTALVRGGEGPSLEGARSRIAVGGSTLKWPRATLLLQPRYLSKCSGNVTSPASKRHVHILTPPSPHAAPDAPKLRGLGISADFSTANPTSAYDTAKFGTVRLLPLTLPLSRPPRLFHVTVDYFPCALIRRRFPAPQRLPLLLATGYFQS